MHHGLRCVGDGELIFHGFMDFNWDRDVVGRESTIMFC
jgi:hypothetical protein